MLRNVGMSLTMALLGAGTIGVLMLVSSASVKTLPSHEVWKYYYAANDTTFSGGVVGTHVLSCSGGQTSDGDTSTGNFKEEGFSCAPSFPPPSYYCNYYISNDVVSSC